MLGEISLRLRARPRGEKPSVPLLVDDGVVVMGSLAIARHADDSGRGDQLFPKGLEAEVTNWADMSDRIIGVGRVKVFHGLRTNREAQREALPSFIPEALKGLFTPVASTGAWFLASKYGVPDDLEAQIAGEMRPALEEVRRALEGRQNLLDTFTFADIAIAASLHAVRPWHRSPIGPATRAVWTQEALASEYRDLLEWRDALYDKHRS